MGDTSGEAGGRDRRATRILILGATGLLGHTLFRHLSSQPGLEVHASVRDRGGLERWFSARLLENVHAPVDARDFDTIIRAFEAAKPQVVINCVGVIKQGPAAEDPLVAIPINSLLPHRLAQLCGAASARLIHFSTDCVFDGARGDYAEDDPPTATDLYGMSKRLGEVSASPHCLTLRTSFIGHELRDRLGLLEWFLAQPARVRGFTRAVFTGFPSIEMARIMAEHVIPDPGLSGVIHVASEAISKYDLLRLIADAYGKRVDIEPDDKVMINRALNGKAFQKATGYVPAPWTALVNQMHEDYLAFYK
jgi:dTDP-4-dehydrorhamnose reductase